MNSQRTIDDIKADIILTKMELDFLYKELVSACNNKYLLNNTKPKLEVIPGGLYEVNK